jgi:hypothetical protein
MCGDTELIITYHVIIYRWKDMWLFGDNWITEDAEIRFLPPGDTNEHDAPCLCMLQTAWQVGSRGVKLNEMVRCGQVGTEAVSHITHCCQFLFHC